MGYYCHSCFGDIDINADDEEDLLDYDIDDIMTGIIIGVIGRGETTGEGGDGGRGARAGLCFLFFSDG